MIAVVQRVVEARVIVDDETIGEIGRGLLALVAVHRADTTDDVSWVAGKMVALRIFRNDEKHFDLNVMQAKGSILLVSNFTVAADTRQGRRPSFDAAADPQKGQQLFDALVQAVRAAGVEAQTGRFGADMRVHLVNDGPVTVLLDSTTRK